MSIAEEYKDLPPRFGRKAVETLFPGIISSKTLARLDSEGKGPDRYRYRRKVVYEKKSFLQWLEKDFRQLKKL
jgi:hypothetical protein